MSEKQPPYLTQESYDDETVKLVKLEDGRDLAIEQRGYGAHAIFDFHGSPSSRFNPTLRNFVLSTLDVKIISFDRPGYGRSTSKPNRQICDTADDVRQAADALGIKRFGMISRSGGVAHALGCAALLPERVTGLVGMAGLAPPDTVRQWSSEMAENNRRKHRLAKHDPEKLIEEYNQHAYNTQKAYHALYDHIYPDLAAPDRLTVPRYGQLQVLISKSHQEGLRQNGQGWFEDTLAVHHAEGWGFDIASIQCPTLLLQGDQDPFVQVSHTIGLCSTIPDSMALIYSGYGHFGTMEFMPPALAYLRDRDIEHDSTNTSVQTHDEIYERFCIRHPHKPDTYPSVIRYRDFNNSRQQQPEIPGNA